MLLLQRAHGWVRGESQSWSLESFISNGGNQYLLKQQPGMISAVITSGRFLSQPMWKRESRNHRGVTSAAPCLGPEVPHDHQEGACEGPQDETPGAGDKGDKGHSDALPGLRSVPC